MSLEQEVNDLRDEFYDMKRRYDNEEIGDNGKKLHWSKVKAIGRKYVDKVRLLAISKGGITVPQLYYTEEGVYATPKNPRMITLNKSGTEGVYATPPLQIPKENIKLKVVEKKAKNQDIDWNNPFSVATAKPVTPRARTPRTPRLQLEMPTTPKGKFLKTPRLKRPPKTPIPEEKTRKYLKENNVELPIVGEDIEIAIPEFFASPYKTKTGAIKYRLVNPLTKARYLASRQDEPSIKIIRKPIEDAVIMENNSQPIPLFLFTPKDRETINRYFKVVKANSDKPADQVPNTADFRNKERGRPEILPKNIEVMRSRGQMPNTNVDVYAKPLLGNLPKNVADRIGFRLDNEDYSPRSAQNFSPRSNQSFSETPQPQKKKRGPYKKHKPSKYATLEEQLEAERAQKREWARKAEERKKGLKTSYEKDDWVKGMITDIDKKAKKPKKLSKKEQRIAEQEALGANAGAVSGEGLNEKNKIFSNVIMPKSKKVCSECGMKNCDCDDEDIEGMGLYASGSGLYAGNGLYASGGQPPRGRGIKHLHHYHRTEMTGEGIVHHHHHMEGGSIGSDIKKAFAPVQKAFQPVTQAINKVEQVATPYNAEVVGHYALPAIGSAVGGVIGSVGGPVGGVIGSAGGSYGGYQLQKELGYDDNKTFQGFGMKNKKGSPEAKEWGRRMREARLAKMNK